MSGSILRVGALVIVGLAAIIFYAATFVVQQTQSALVLRFGAVRSVVTEPGLYLKLPAPFEQVILLDNRILDLDLPAQEIIASDQKRLVVDAFARYRIKDALRFYQSVGTIQAANQQLTTLLNAALRRVLGETTFTHVVRDERAPLMRAIREQLNQQAAIYGITVNDVRIRRADLPEQNSQAVYQRMQTERQREAAEFRAQGAQRGQEIRSRADRDSTIIVAEATSQSEQIRGQGDGDRNRIFAEAYGKDPEFFAFYRSMIAYESGLKSSDTRLLLRPDSDFFRFFGSAAGRPPASAPATTGNQASPAR
jgi:membrane protease subunit HflC